MPTRRLLGGLLMAVGGSIVLLCGSCSGFYLVRLAIEVWQYWNVDFSHTDALNMSPWVIFILIPGIGILLTVTGIAVSVRGRRVVKRASLESVT